MLSRSTFSAMIILSLCLLLAFSDTNIFYNYIDKKISIGTITDKTKPLDESRVFPSKPSSINFVGDIMLGRDVESYLKMNGSDYSFRKISFNVRDSYTLGNFESAIPETHLRTPNNTFRFSTDSKYLEGLSRAGFTHMSLANNHTFDFGLPGYNNTITKLWDNNIEPFGHPTTLSTSSVTLLKMSNANVAIIGIHTLFTKPKPEDIKAVLEYANTISDYQIVYIHWGDEYQEKQSISQRKLVEEFSMYGTDLVIGHHPHVVQGIERVNDTLVLYSLGNYIFDQYFSDSVQNGLIATLDFTEEPKVILTPVSSLGSRAQPEYMNEDLAKIFLQRIAKNSSPDITSLIEERVIPLSLKLASSTEVFIMAE